MHFVYADDEEGDFEDEIEDNVNILNVAYRAVFNILEVLLEDIQHWDDEDEFGLEDKTFVSKYFVLDFCRTILKFCYR